MTSLKPWASLALFASSALARPQSGIDALWATSIFQKRQTDSTATTSNITLAPVTSQPTDEIIPQANITLGYGQNDTSSDAVVNITLTTTYDGVLLESIESITAVDCSSNGVSLTFSDADTLASAYGSWSSFDLLLLVTNHMGDCDTEFERGFFVSSSYETFESNLTLVASASKKDLADVASKSCPINNLLLPLESFAFANQDKQIAFMRANFSGIPSTASSSSGAAKRDIVVDPDEVTVAADFDFGPVTLYSYEDYVTVTANKAAVDVSVTLGGYLDFDIWTLSLESLYVDVETTASADLSLGLNVTGAYNTTFSYDVGYEYYVVDVAGILTFGPEISLSVGADLDLDAEIDVTLALGAGIPNGTLHLDLVGDNTAATGWDEPTYYANLTLSEEGSIGVTPYLSVTVGIEFEVLGGLLDLSSGLTPKISFPTTVTLDGEQEIGVGSGTNNTVTITQPGSDGCSNGVEVDSDFEFTLDAFVTEYWNTTLYDYNVSIADVCYSWA